MKPKGSKTGSTAVKISADFVAVVREEAKAAERSIAGQLEHWAKIGRSVESAVSARTANALKYSENDPESPIGHQDRESALAILSNLRESLPSENLAQRLRERSQQTGHPLYEADPKNSSGIVRVNPDGTKTPGRLEGRTFIPSGEVDEEDEDSHRYLQKAA